MVCSSPGFVGWDLYAMNDIKPCQLFSALNILEEETRLDRVLDVAQARLLFTVAQTGFKTGSSCLHF